MTRSILIPAQADDGHRFELIARIPAQPRAQLLWLPALGVSARNYQAFADALATRGVAVFLHEWRGNGSSSLRPSRTQDWAYREILQQDLPASLAAVRLHGTAPLIIGGHSLGGQLACVFAGQHPSVFERFWLVATGTPYWRTFPAPRGWLLPLVYRFLPWLAQRQGTLPGRRLGFGGTEARGLIKDWARVGLSNHYAAVGMADDLDRSMQLLHGQAQAVVLEQDWFAPVGSMRGLLAKLPQVRSQLQVVPASALGTRADHFAWMKSPGAVVEALFHSFE
ncbi:alpha/beta fold hydrolase [Stenotrophomonas sp. 278]|uniref:alpha/beta hydrolase family protein n=1 Tax=Stenotrophomonas sp. 278 TaxID=2479851 RepID=UPI000F67AE93|nr:alpha/beta fold hydrolase [Stenotrophomonas sp. 278]RRU07840.1 alpha/beta fold hydrolase [Stenotrophomonas sp. 278]